MKIIFVTFAIFCATHGFGAEGNNLSVKTNQKTEKKKTYWFSNSQYEEITGVFFAGRAFGFRLVEPYTMNYVNGKIYTEVCEGNSVPFRKDARLVFSTENGEAKVTAELR